MYSFDRPPRAIALKLDLAVSLKYGFRVSMVAVNIVSRNEASGISSASSNRSQKRTARSLWDGVLAIPRHPQRTDEADAVPLMAMCTGDVSASRSPRSRTSSTLAVSAPT